MATRAPAKRPARRPQRRPKPVAKAKARPTVEIEDLQDFNESINLLVYGDSGVGKTPFCGTAPNAVFLSTEKGSISAKRFGSKAKLMRATNWARIEVAIEMLEAHPERFDWVIIDSLTKMQQLLIRSLLEDNVEEGRAKADLDIPQIQDHQKWQNKFKRFVDRLIDLDVNCIFICTAMHKEDAEGDDLVLPDLQGKDYAIAQYVCAQMDAVLCLKVADEPDDDGNPVWKLLTKAKPPYFAKERYNALATIIYDPNMAECIEAIEASGDDEGGNPNVARRRARRGGAEPDEDESDAYTEAEADWHEGDEDEPEDDETTEDEPDEDDEPPARKPRRKPSATTRRAKPATKRRTAPEPDDEDEPDEAEEDDEDDEAPPRRRTARRSARKAPASRKPARRRKAEPEDDEDDDDFDPEDGDEVDFDDED